MDITRRFFNRPSTKSLALIHKLEKAAAVVTIDELWLRLSCCRELAANERRAIFETVRDATDGNPGRVLEVIDARWRARLLATDISAELSWRAYSDNHHIIGLTDQRYPPLLAEIPDPPPVIFVRGDSDVLCRPALAVVGSRRATPAGLAQVAEFVTPLANAGMVIVSGLAMGIDTEAHRAALAGGGPTVAVFATGVDRTYPAQNRALASHIAAAGGALVSELPLGTAPRRRLFPLRNRIISGLSLATLVVEASQRSGSLITARLAGEQGRDVFAVPGSIRSRFKQGCHRLIRDGAVLVASPQQVIDALVGFRQRQPLPDPCRSPGPSNLSDDERALLSMIGFEPCFLDELAARSGWPVAKIAATLSELEVRGIVASQPGQGFQRLR